MRKYGYFLFIANILPAIYFMKKITTLMHHYSVRFDEYALIKGVILVFILYAINGLDLLLIKGNKNESTKNDVNKE